ncbi:MAG: hypothetical protein KAJ24_04420, partial [Candidatus Aenigmarchaeota archaeon]|nr:hypothetical protein [Candidatus Aenigmarchaeota archaeon]
MNSTCTNTTEDVFVNTTEVPGISSLEMSLPYPLENTTFTATTSMESQIGYSLGVNISNSSNISEALNISWTGHSSLDTTTNEPYNSSSNTWVSSINTPAGKYNITASLTNDLGQTANKSTLTYVFPAVNATFNITNHTGHATGRTVSISIDFQGQHTWTYEINGVSTLTLLNNSYFYPELDRPMHVQVKKEISSDENASVTFLNSTIGTTMDLVSEYYENRRDFSDRIIYGVYAYRSSWNYNSSRLYLRLSTDPMRISGSATIYACESWNFDSASCTSGWVDVSIVYKNVQGNLVEIEGLSNKTEAFALGEPSYCGDGHCSAFESCSSCVTDCGSCSTSPSSDPPATPSGGGDTPLKSITTTPNEIITKISVNLKTEILGPSLNVSKLASRSVGATSNIVYYYFEISTVNITESNIENTTI